MSDSTGPRTGRFTLAETFETVASGLAFGFGLLMVGVGVGSGGVEVPFFLLGVLPLAVGLVGLARARWHSGSASSQAPAVAEPFEELKRRYATGELEDDELERKVELLLAADDGRRRPDVGREREPEPASR